MLKKNNKISYRFRCGHTRWLFSTWSNTNKDSIGTIYNEENRLNRVQQIKQFLPVTLYSRVNGEYMFKTTPEYLYSFLTMLKYHTKFRYFQLRGLTSIDQRVSKLRFEVVYLLLSIQNRQRLSISVSLPEGISLPSLISLYSSAGWYERETWDRFGVFFRNHPDFRRRLTDYGFKGHSLRKEFPLRGFVEVSYDDFSKRILYKGVNLAQEFRIFNLANPWKVDYGLPFKFGRMPNVQVRRFSTGKLTDIVTKTVVDNTAGATLDIVTFCTQKMLTISPRIVKGLLVTTGIGAFTLACYSGLQWVPGLSSILDYFYHLPPPSGSLQRPGIPEVASETALAIEGRSPGGDLMEKLPRLNRRDRGLNPERLDANGIPKNFVSREVYELKSNQNRNLVLDQEQDLAFIHNPNAPEYQDFLRLRPIRDAAIVERLDELNAVERAWKQYVHNVDYLETPFLPHTRQDFEEYIIWKQKQEIFGNYSIDIEREPITAANWYWFSDWKDFKRQNPTKGFFQWQEERVPTFLQNTQVTDAFLWDTRQFENKQALAEIRQKVVDRRAIAQAKLDYYYENYGGQDGTKSGGNNYRGKEILVEKKDFPPGEDSSYWDIDLPENWVDHTAEFADTQMTWKYSLPKSYPYDRNNGSVYWDWKIRDPDKTRTFDQWFLSRGFDDRETYNHFLNSGSPWNALRQEANVPFHVVEKQYNAVSQTTVQVDGSKNIFLYTVGALIGGACIVVYYMWCLFFYSFYTLNFFFILKSSLMVVFLLLYFLFRSSSG